MNFPVISKNRPIILLGIVLVAIVVVSCHVDPRHQGKPIWRTLLTWPEGVAALAVLLTLFFIAWQAILMRQSVTASEEVSKRELRAYLTVVIGQAIFQERRSVEDGGDLMFECRPLIVNSGQTPARKVTFKARAAIIRHSEIRGIHLPEDPDVDSGGSVIGPRRSAKSNRL